MLKLIRYFLAIVNVTCKSRPEKIEVFVNVDLYFISLILYTILFLACTDQVGNNIIIFFRNFFINNIVTDRNRY